MKCKKCKREISKPTLIGLDASQKLGFGRWFKCKCGQFQEVKK